MVLLSSREIPVSIHQTTRGVGSHRFRPGPVGVRQSGDRTSHGHDVLCHHSPRSSAARPILPRTTGEPPRTPMNVIDWLLDSDPAIRWQVMRDLTHEPADVVAAERSRVALEGWGARLLALQGPDGQGGGGTLFPEWTSTTHTLLLLRYMGLDPMSAQARRAVALVRDNAKWDHAGQAYFSGEVEPCINGKAVAIGSYFGQEVSGIVDRLLGEQMSDGGWNCEQENGSTRGSFHSTIDVLEGLLEHEQSVRSSPELTAARQKGEAYLL